MKSMESANAVADHGDEIVYAGKYPLTLWGPPLTQLTYHPTLYATIAPNQPRPISLNAELLKVETYVSPATKANRTNATPSADKSSHSPL